MTPSSQVSNVQMERGATRRSPWKRWRAWCVSAAAIVLVAAAYWRWQDYALLVEGQRAYDVGRWEVALRLAREQLRRDSNDRPARLLAARSALRLGNWQLAETYFAQARPTHVEDLRLRVEGLIRLRSWRVAGEICQQILDLDPRDGLAAQRLAFTRYQLGDVEGAIDLCQQWRDDPQHGVNARAMLGWIYFDRADNRNAVEEFEAVLASDPEPHQLPFPMERLLLDLGKALLRLGYPDRAEHYLDQAIESSSDPEVAWRLGMALQQQRRDDEAAACWTQALELNPEFTPAMVSLGEHAMQQKEPSKALEWFTRAERLEPNVNRIHYGLSRAYLLLGETELARVHRERADELRLQEEEQTLQYQAIQMSPRSPMARLQRAVEAASVGNWNEAQEIIQQLLNENPGNQNLENLLRRVQARLPLQGSTP